MAKYCCCDNFYESNEFIKGGRVKFRELPIASIARLSTVMDDEFTIEKLVFKITPLGELSILVELKELPGNLFSPSVFSAVRVDATPVKIANPRTIDTMINNINELTEENSYLRSTLNHGVLHNFEK